MWKIAFTVCIFCGAMAIAQSRVPSAGGMPTSNSPGATRDSASADAANENHMELKSTDQVLRDNPKLTANLKTMLPADVTPEQACSTFKTLEQCVTTIHAAQNLKLNFSDLKAKTTGKGSMNLQKAVEQMAAGSNAKDEVKKAKKQAADDMKGVSLFGFEISPHSVTPPVQPISTVQTS